MKTARLFKLKRVHPKAKVYRKPIVKAKPKTLEEQLLDLMDLSEFNDKISHTGNKNNPVYRDLFEFLEEFKIDKNRIAVGNNQVGPIEKSNIVNQLEKISYYVPLAKITKLFDLMDKCAKQKLSLSLAELQNADSSGLMFDFDINQDSDISQLDDILISTIVKKILEIIINLLDLTKQTPFESYAAVIKKPNPIYKKELSTDSVDCYRDGIHIIIPGIKLSRKAKRFIMDKIS